MGCQAWLARPDEKGQAELLTAFVQDLTVRCEALHAAAAEMLKAMLPPHSQPAWGSLEAASRKSRGAQEAELLPHLVLLTEGPMVLEE